MKSAAKFQDAIILHCVKSVGIWSFSGPHFPALGLNTDQKNFKYGYFSRSFRQIPCWQNLFENTGQQQVTRVTYKHANLFVVDFEQVFSRKISI